MAEVNDNVEFTVGEDGIQFNTKTNGDTIRMTGLHLTDANAGGLAYLINKGVTLKVEIKEN